MNKKKPIYSNNKKLYVCPRCLEYYYNVKRNCNKCGCTKGLISVMKNPPMTLKEVPNEDWCRIIPYRKNNGYEYIKYEVYYKVAKKLGVKIPRDDKPCYLMKGLRAPKAQRGGFTGVANHAGVLGYVHSINGGGCSPR